MSKPSGNLFVIAAPSGAGKTSLVKALSKSLPRFNISVSHTTRAMRPGEVDGENYFFVDTEAFNQMVADDAFLEHAMVFDRQYGTSREWVLSQLANNVDVVLEIDWQGAQQVQRIFPDAVLIFIVPPSIEALQNRLHDRQQDAPETIEKRMQLANDEMSHFSDFDYLVVNDQFDEALADLSHIVLSHRLEMRVQAQKQADLLDNLLKKQ